MHVVYVVFFFQNVGMQITLRNMNMYMKSELGADIYNRYKTLMIHKRHVTSLIIQFKCNFFLQISDMKQKNQIHVII